MTEFTDYREHRSRAELDALLRHAHFIPMTKGHSHAYVLENHPGWTWNGLMEVWQAAGILVKDGEGRLRCDVFVKAVHFDTAYWFAIEWIDGTVTRWRGGPTAAD